ncbi:hypothetical protein MRB53_008936 [Persea americana]|uniref:Uncharacterized protein n=1 Tax=Persea americana TaxID=3435 RepID=A0ACC2LMM4_PERAE|nr:hypothetical protein MRB53_008936 [Persea americana]
MLSFSLNPLFSFSLIIGRYLAVAHNNSLNKTVFDVGIVLDLKTPPGNMSKICISMALDDFYAIHDNFTTELKIHWRDSNEDSVDAASTGMFVTHAFTHPC